MFERLAIFWLFIIIFYIDVIRPLPNLCRTFVFVPGYFIFIIYILTRNAIMYMFTSLWEIISWKTKPRYDSASDHYTRIFMPKLFLLASFIMAFSYFNDKLNCMVSNRLDMSREFVQETCWIQGFYVYHDMHTRLNMSSYYGIPEDMGYDGIDILGGLCVMKDRSGKVNRKCKPMQRRYFLHYQWIPFYVCSLVILYYSPYLLFKMVNTDMIGLVDSVRIGDKDVDKIVNTYFNYRVNSKIKMKFIIWINLAIKIIYIVVNFLGFLATDYVMDGRFLSFGFNWYEWNHYPNHIAHDITKRTSPKPGEYLLPSVGICDIHEALHDKRALYIDKHRVVCEISQNIRYQYMLIIIWFFFAIGVCVSILGLLHSFYVIGKSMFWIYWPKFSYKETLSDRVTAQLAVREVEYLDKIKSIDMSVYAEILLELTRYRPDLTAVKKYANSPNGGEALTLLPTAPQYDNPV